ncbi:MAG: hypothetical protein FWF57_09030 [Defluviitaleaceae bacterium]|nr:hypothetical protein [Defluviitaleaceae bacterium]
MDGKEMYKIWAKEDANIWTSFTKPSLFINIPKTYDLKRLKLSKLKMDVISEIESISKNTIVIIDLPSEGSIKKGLSFAMDFGFRPIPLYNGVNLDENQKTVIDNSNIINTLKNGTLNLLEARISSDANPAFLLDSNRNISINTTNIIKNELYDNRYSIGKDDLPGTDYLKKHGIEKIFVYTNTNLNRDLEDILLEYKNKGLDILIYDGTKIRKEVDSELQNEIMAFENGKFVIMLFSILAFVNLFSQFTVRQAPFLWTTPTLPWLTYLWLDETLADVIAVVIPVLCVITYFKIKDNRNLLPVFFWLFIIDAIIYFIYVMYYGVASFTGYSSGYGLIVFGIPIVIFMFLLRAYKGYRNTRYLSKKEYLEVLEIIDQKNGYNYTSSGRIRRSRYRGYRGYGGSGYGSGYGG